MANGSWKCVRHVRIEHCEYPSFTNGPVLTTRTCATGFFFCILSIVVVAGTTIVYTARAPLASSVCGPIGARRPSRRRTLFRRRRQDPPVDGVAARPVCGPDGWPAAIPAAGKTRRLAGSLVPAVPCDPHGPVDRWTGLWRIGRPATRTRDGPRLGAATVRRPRRVIRRLRANRSGILTWWRGQPWSLRRFLQVETVSLHSGTVDPCEYPLCGYLGHVIFGSWDCVRAVPRILKSVWNSRNEQQSSCSQTITPPCPDRIGHIVLLVVLPCFLRSFVVRCPQRCESLGFDTRMVGFGARPNCCGSRTIPPRSIRFDNGNRIMCKKRG